MGLHVPIHMLPCPPASLDLVCVCVCVCVLIPPQWNLSAPSAISIGHGPPTGPTPPTLHPPIQLHYGHPFVHTRCMDNPPTYQTYGQPPTNTDQTRNAAVCSDELFVLVVEAGATARWCKPNCGSDYHRNNTLSSKRQDWKKKISH